MTQSTPPVLNTAEPEFEAWFNRAYRPQHVNFTIHNMEVAFHAGKAAALASTPVAAEPTACPTLPFQAGMNNVELAAAWTKKLPGVKPTQDELTAFAVGSEVGFDRARQLEKQDWNRFHHVMQKHGLHPGRTEDSLIDILDSALSAAPPVPPAEASEPVAWGIRDCVWLKIVTVTLDRSETEDYKPEHVVPLYAALPAPVSSQPEGWQPIETAPEGREMFVIKAFDVPVGNENRLYTSDPYCTWRQDCGFARWPHHFDPTHWAPLPAAPTAPKEAP